MKKVFVFALLSVFLITGLTVLAGDAERAKKAIKVAPPSPKIKDQERQAELALRRKKVAAAMADNSILVMFSAEPKIYTNDVDYHYRQENNLYYLTALRQGNISLVITKNGDSVSEYLFVPKRNPQFETWNGRMYSNEDVTRLSGIQTIYNASDFASFLTALATSVDFRSNDGEVQLTNLPKTVYVIQGNKREFAMEAEFAGRVGESRVRNAAPIFAKLRLVKSPYELKMMQHAIDITSEALMRSMGMIGRAKYEYEVQAEVEYTFRRRNADYWGYPSIVGCGPNATTLHYIESQGEVKKGDLMLMDVGAEYEHYTADVTRSFPVSGKFTKEQAEIYQIVYDAQEAAARELKPGSTVGAAGEAARRVIAEGLYKLGLITDKDSGQESIWYMHGWGHWLGMNVHDVGNYGTTLEEGMIMTNEPGIYIREDALDYLPDTDEGRAFREKVGPVFERYKNIGVRIEDDMLITKTGVEWMSDDLPRTIKDVEDFMARASKEMNNYALRQKPADSVFAVHDFGTDSHSFENRYGFLYQRGYLNGQTLRSGWVENPKTIEIHGH
jgi:Xaa-Pro aminopeptidase